MTPGADDIIAKLSMVTELRLHVGIDADLGMVEIGGRVQIEDARLPTAYTGVMAPNAALDLAWRLIGACTRLRKVGVDQPAPGSAGPLSSTY